MGLAVGVELEIFLLEVGDDAALLVADDDGDDDFVNVDLDFEGGVRRGGFPWSGRLGGGGERDQREEGKAAEAQGGLSG